VGLSVAKGISVPTGRSERLISRSENSSNCRSSIAENGTALRLGQDNEYHLKGGSPVREHAKQNTDGTWGKRPGLLFDKLQRTVPPKKIRKLHNSTRGWGVELKMRADPHGRIKALRGNRYL